MVAEDVHGYICAYDLKSLRYGIVLGCDSHVVEDTTHEEDVIGECRGRRGLPRRQRWGWLGYGCSYAEAECRKREGEGIVLVAAVVLRILVTAIYQSTAGFGHCQGWGRMRSAGWRFETAAT